MRNIVNDVKPTTYGSIAALPFGYFEGAVGTTSGVYCRCALGLVHLSDSNPDGWWSSNSPTITVTRWLKPIEFRWEQR